MTFLKTIQSTVAVVTLTALTASAEEPSVWSPQDFSAKRISAGSSTGLVQIDPDAEVFHLTPTKDQLIDLEIRRPDPQSLEGHAAWFWSGISPDLEASDPARLPKALGQLSLSEEPLSPNWANLALMVESYGASLIDSAEGTRVSPALALAVMSVESAGRSDALSKAGASGLMQLMPATAARFGVEDPLIPEDNIKGGVNYLNFLLRTFGDDPILALAAYNAGEGAVIKNEGVPPYEETRNYVPKVLSAWAMARLFCRVPPEAVTDACAFAFAEG